VTEAGRVTVLVVDDEAAIRDLLREALELTGFGVEAVSDGRTALQRAQELLPDLVLTDLMMPGLSGRDLARQLKAVPATADIPIVLMSAAYQVEADDHFAAVIPKPFELDTLLEMLEHLGI
jgi:two-component system, OmpR family, response regulator VicR